MTTTRQRLTLVNIQPFDGKILFEIGEMESSPTGNIQETVPCGTTILMHESGELSASAL